MKKSYLVIGSAFIAALIIFNTGRVNSEIPFPPAGNSGDPLTNNSCARSGCHPSPSNTPSANDLAINIGTTNPTTPLTSSFEYAGGTEYNIAFLPNAFTGRYGFQLIALDASDQMAGSFTVTNAATTKIVTAGGYQYMGHLNASSFKQWVFKWTAPAASTGPVTFYYAYNTADNNDQATGDVIYKGNVTINPEFNGVNDLSNTVADLKVFPNPVSSEFGLSFEAKENADMKADVYSLNGTLVKNLFDETIQTGSVNRIFNVNDLAAGVYMVKLASGDGFVTQKFFKQ